MNQQPDRQVGPPSGHADSVPPARLQATSGRLDRRTLLDRLEPVRFEGDESTVKEEFEKLSYTIMTFLGAQGIADGWSKGATSHSTKK